MTPGHMSTDEFMKEMGVISSGKITLKEPRPNVKEGNFNKDLQNIENYNNYTSVGAIQPAPLSQANLAQN